MRKPLPLLGALLALSALAIALPSAGGPEKITLPDYKKHVLYHKLDRPDVKQVRDLYGNAEALKPAKDGQPLAAGTVC